MAAQAQEQVKNNPAMAKQAETYMKDPNAIKNMQNMMDADPAMAKEAQESYEKYGSASGFDAAGGANSAEKEADTKKATESDDGGGGDIMAKMRKMMADPERAKKAMEAMKKPGRLRASLCVCVFACPCMCLCLRVSDDL